MTNNFGTIFEYKDWTMHEKTIVYSSCTMHVSGVYYTHIELDPSDGTLTYYKNGVHCGKRWISL